MQDSFAVVGLVVAGLCVGCSQPLSPTGPTSIQSSATPLALSGGNATTVAETAITDRETQEIPFKGNLEGVVALHFNQPPFLWWSMSGSGLATALGRFTVTITTRLASDIEHAHGFYSFTAANGDILNAFFVGAGRAQADPSIFSIVENADIFDGTGRFLGATGTFTVQRLYDTTTGKTTGSIEGTISLGHARNHP